MRLIKFVLQIIILSGFSYLGYFIAKILHWNVPGSIIGLILLFALLQLKVVKMQWFEQGASWLVAELLLFYVPSAVGIIQYGQLMRADGLRLVIVIAISTALVMISTGLLADKIANTRLNKG